MSDTATHGPSDEAPSAPAVGTVDDVRPYDALLLVSFGGPDGPDDVLPFLERVTAGRGIARERLIEVGAHYHHFGGRSPINGHNRALLASLRDALAHAGPDGGRLPVYWGNRNWHPFIDEAVDEMRADGVRSALAFVTSPYSSYSSCRQYREELDRARGDLVIDKLRTYFDHPGFVVPMADHLGTALAATAAPAGAPVVFSAHSIPTAMAAGCEYAAQLHEAARLIAAGAQVDASRWSFAWQSRSGPPGQPWLEPDIADRLRELRAGGVEEVVVVPVGFISDHMEVVWDLDTQAAGVATQLGMRMVRAATVGTDPRFVEMIVELVRERTVPGTPRRSLGRLGVPHDRCALACCPPPALARPR